MHINRCYFKQNAYHCTAEKVISETDHRCFLRGTSRRLFHTLPLSVQALTRRYDFAA